MCFFNTADPYNPAIRYTLPPAQQLSEVAPLAESDCLVLAPSAGKTTALLDLARDLTALVWAADGLGQYGLKKAESP